MLSMVTRLFRRDKSATLVAKILAEVSNREELLGMKTPIIPTPEGIKVDASKLLKYTDSNGYKKFAEEAWAQIIGDLDKILDVRTSRDQRDYYCGAVNSTLNLLRLSHKAKLVIEEWDRQHPATLRQVVHK